MEKQFSLQITDPRFKELDERLEKMRARAYEFAQSRSSFQIEKFIGCDEYTPVSKYRHLAHNSYVMLNSARDMILEREKILRRLDKLKRETNRVEEFRDFSQEEKDQNLDIKFFELFNSLEDIEISIKGALQEINIFEKLCDQLEKDNGKPFTYADFEADQPNYWKLRFANQMHCNQFASKIPVGEGNYKSYLQALEKPILNDSPNEIDKMGLEFNDLAITALMSREGINKKMLEKVSVDQRKLE